MTINTNHCAQNDQLLDFFILLRCTWDHLNVKAQANDLHEKASSGACNIRARCIHTAYTA